MIEIQAREICNACGGTGHEENGHGLSCLKCRGLQYVLRWIPLEDLKLSAELTEAIKSVFSKSR